MASTERFRAPLKAAYDTRLGPGDFHTELKAIAAGQQVFSVGEYRFKPPDSPYTTDLGPGSLDVQPRAMTAPMAGTFSKTERPNVVQNLQAGQHLLTPGSPLVKSELGGNLARLLAKLSFDTLSLFYCCMGYYVALCSLLCLVGTFSDKCSTAQFIRAAQATLGGQGV